MVKANLKKTIKEWREGKLKPRKYPEKKKPKKSLKQQFTERKAKMMTGIAKVEDTVKLSFWKIIKVLEDYIDMREEYYPIVTLWIIGTYFHKQFPAYPYLFFNAMKGSGKTRILNLISHLACNGKHLISMSEAVLFRTAALSTFCIDEMERIGGKDKQALRELLNAGYKKGLAVERAKKVKKKGLEGMEENYEIESYELYCPIAMANIWGMDEVLADRCISLTLEKSNNPIITRLIEDFKENKEINDIKRELSELSVVCVGKNSRIQQWNKYILTLYNKENNTNYTNNITNTNNTNNTFFNKIEKTNLNSRHLELFFPLFILADYAGVVDKVIKIANYLVKEKKAEDVDESKDVSLIEFVSKQEDTNFVSLKDILTKFRIFLGEDEENKWINSKWLGRALKRLVLIKEKRRIGKGREVILNIEKAKKKIKIFKEVEPEPQENLKITSESL